MGTSKQAGGDRVSTISLLGCSTSVALATGPTDEEECITVHRDYIKWYIIDINCIEHIMTFHLDYNTRELPY